jgi:hypothetical protein
LVGSVFNRNVMDIQITIPLIVEIFSRGVPLKVVAENERWSQDHLGEYAKKSGVYIHHVNNQILYVGQTSKSAKWGNFHVRLRRECQPKAASNSDLYKILFQHAEQVKTTMYHFDEIKEMFSGTAKESLSCERMTLILEQFMIAAYKPIGNKK